MKTINNTKNFAKVSSISSALNKETKYSVRCELEMNTLEANTEEL